MIIKLCISIFFIEFDVKDERVVREVQKIFYFFVIVCARKKKFNFFYTLQVFVFVYAQMS